MELVNPDDLNSVEARLKLEIVEKLSEPCDRKTYGERLRSAAQKLECSVRTVQRLMKKWEEEGISALIDSGRQDKGKPRIAEDWQQFIKATYSNGKCTPAQVFTKVRQKARREGLKD